MKLKAELSTKLEGRFRLEVVGADGSVRYPLGHGWHKNLILNSGKDLFFTLSSGNLGSLPRLMDWCRAGTGTTAAAVTDTVLQAQVKSSNTYNTGAGNNGTVDDLVLGKRTFKRTYEFSSETGTVNYGELGISNASSGNLFSRIVITPVAVNSGENLRVVYELTVSVPQIITASSTSGTSGTFNVEGDMKFVGPFGSIFPNIAANGTSSDTFRSNILNGWAGTYSLGGPSRTLGLALRTSVAFPAVNNVIAATGSFLASEATAANVNNSAYVSGSFEKTSSWTLLASNPGTTVTTIGTVTLTVNDNSSFPNVHSTNYGIQVNLDSNQTKGGDFRLTLEFKWTVTS